MTPSEYRPTPRLPALPGASRRSRLPRPGAPPALASAPAAAWPLSSLGPARPAWPRARPAGAPAPRRAGPAGSRRFTPCRPEGRPAALTPRATPVPRGRPAPNAESSLKGAGPGSERGRPSGSAPSSLSQRAAPGPLRQAGSERECSA